MKRVNFGVKHQFLSRNFLVQQTGDDIYLQADKHRIGQPYLRLQKRAVSSSDVAVSGHTGNFAIAPRQTSLALRCALAMVIAIKITLLKKTLQVRFCQVNLIIIIAQRLPQEKKVPCKISGINSSNSSFLTFSPFFDIGCPVVSYIKYIGTFRWAITGEEIRISSES